MTIREFANITRNDWNNQIKNLKDEGLIADLGDNVEAYYIALSILDDDTVHCFLPIRESLSFSFKSSPTSLWGSGMLSWGGPTSEHSLDDASLKKRDKVGEKIARKLINRDFTTSLVNPYLTISKNFEYIKISDQASPFLRYNKLLIKIGANSDEVQARLIKPHVGLDNYRSLLSVYLCDTSKLLDVDQN